MCFCPYPSGLCACVCVTRRQAGHILNTGAPHDTAHGYLHDILTFWSSNVHISTPRMSQTSRRMYYHKAAIVQLLLLPCVHLQVSSVRSAKRRCYASVCLHAYCVQYIFLV